MPPLEPPAAPLPPPAPRPPAHQKKQIALVHWRPLAAQLTLARATSTPDSRAMHDTHCSQKRHSDLEWSAGGELHAGQVFGPDSRMHARRASVRPRLQDACTQGKCSAPTPGCILMPRSRTARAHGVVRSRAGLPRTCPLPCIHGAEWAGHTMLVSPIGDYRTR